MIIFVPTQNDTILGCSLLKNKNINSFCIELHAKSSDQDKNLAKNKNNTDKFKVIIATNVAESSLTFDGLVYVIDTGLELVSRFDCDKGIQVIKKSPTTQAQIKQRIGRVGRTSPGVAYHLYTENQYNNFLLYPEPNILTSDITNDILSLMHFYNINELQDFLNDLITKPTQAQINYSIYKLQFYNCIGFVENNGRITAIGRAILKIRNIDLISAYAILISKYLNCQNEIIIIMAIINNLDGSIDKLFNYTKLKKFKKYIHKYSYTNSDHITLLNIYQHLYANHIHEYFNINKFKKIDKTISDIHKYMSYFNDSHYEYMNKYDLMSIEPFDKIDDNILYVLYKAYQFNLIKNNKTINFINNIEGKLDFNNATISNIKNNNNYFISHNIINIFGKQLFTCCSEIPKDII